MSSEDNIASQQAFGDAVNSGNLDAFENLVAADSVDHDPAPDQRSRTGGLPQLLHRDAHSLSRPAHRG